MHQAQTNTAAISLHGARTTDKNNTHYIEPADAASVESNLLRISRDAATCPTLTNSERSAISSLVMGLSGLRQYNRLLACDGPLAGRHGCLFVAGQGLFGESGAPKEVPQSFEPFQSSLIKSYTDASQGELSPKPLDLESVVQAGTLLLQKLMGAATPDGRSD